MNIATLSNEFTDVSPINDVQNALDENDENDSNAEENESIMEIDNELDESDADETTENLVSLEERLSVNDLCDMEQQAKETIDEYMTEHILRMSAPSFTETLINDITGYLFEEWISAGICEEHDYDDITELVRRIQIEYFEIRNIPLREEPTIAETAQSFVEILPKIEHIRNVDQPAQRTPEWYETRYNLLTASNAWKIFSSPAQYNSLIYEKCKPMDIHDYGKSGISVDSNNSLQFGIRYEPLSIMLYERLYNTKVSDVGCIPHTQYPCLGASPDGIVMELGGSRYGRMIEVKNIVNREITGVPLESYWIQMQLQMEVCDLDECDFIETRFLQYDTLDELLLGKEKKEGPDVIPEEHIEDDAICLDDTRQKGMVLYFYPRIAISDVAKTPDVQPEYAYLPLDIEINSEAATEWTKAQCLAREKHILYKKTYWVLDQFSCVLVRRNRDGFGMLSRK